MATGPTATAIAVSGRPFSPRMGHLSPRMATKQVRNQPDGRADLFSSFICGGSDQPFALCDASEHKNDVDFDINPTGVYIAVHTKQWNLASERVKLYPHEASIWVVRHFNADNTLSAEQSMTDMVAMASPRSGGFTISTTKNVIRWRMLPLHASLLFGGPIELIRVLINAYPAACRMQDDQGMLPLHVAFRFGASEEIVVLLLDTYPEAIEEIDHKGRLPSMVSPKDALSYSSTIGEAFIRGPSYYYWSARVSAAERIQSEVAMTAKIKEIEENARTSSDMNRELMEKTEKQLTDEIEALSIENVELKERLTWYETKYEGAEEKEKVLVDHANSLAERLRLTSLSEEHLATKLAKLEDKLHNVAAELKEKRENSTDEVKALKTKADHLEHSLSSAENEAKSLSKKLEKKNVELKEMKLRFERERKLFEKQLDTSKECLQELVASSKEDKRMFEEETKALREQMMSLQCEIKKASLNDKRLLEEKSQTVHKQVLHSEVQKQSRKTSNNVTQPTNIVIPKSLEERLDNLQRELANNTALFMSQLHGNEVDEKNMHSEGSFEQTKSSKNEPIKPPKRINHKSFVSRHQPNDTNEFEDWGVESIDTYVSTRSLLSQGIEDEQARDDTEVFESNFSSLGDIEALNVLTEEQRIALERLDLSRGRDELMNMLGKVPGLSQKQVNLLVDVASSLTD